MSLVNDMLRDLDKRRNEASGGASSVSLTPAPELPPGSSKRPVMLYLVAALIIGAGVIFYFWLQQDGSGTTRELNIAPRIAVEQTEPILEESELAQASSAIAIADEGANNNSEQFETGGLSATADLALVEQNNPARGDVAEEESPASESQQETEIASSQEELEVEQSEISAGSEETDVGEEAIPASQVAAATINLGQGPAEEVKNSAQRTPEERDLLAVQQALQLIAENKNTDAYVILEQEILNNRYAHQTRETYAKLLINEGNLRGALELTESGLELSQNHAGLKKIKARLLISQGELNEAVDLLLTRAPPVDEDLEYHEILATAQLAGRDYEGALISYTGLVRQDQNQGKWWYGFAASQDSLGNSNAARQGYSRAMSLSNLSANLRRRSQERLAVLSQ